MASSTPRRVAVVGGGIAGSMCALVLRNRGVQPVIFDSGRRLGGRAHGALFLRVSEASGPFGTVVQQLETHKLVAPWSGRFGVLGKQGGGFLPREIIDQTQLGAMRKPGSDEGSQDASDASPAVSDAGDFCGFIGGSGKESQLFVGTPSMAEVCAGICRLANVDVLARTKVSDLQFQSASASWDLLCSAEGGGDAGGGVSDCVETRDFDAVVLAVHNPALAAKVVGRLAADAASSDADLGARLSRLSAALQDLRDAQKGPLLPLRVHFPSESVHAKVPFDAVTCPTSPDVQFICRHGSMPGAADGGEGQEMWTAVPTSRLSRELLRRGVGEEEQAQEIFQHLSGLLEPFFAGSGGVPAPARLSVKRWGAGLTLKPLGLKEDCIGLEPWRLGICGDFLREAPGGGPLEAAALSGYSMGERVASWLTA